MSPHLSLRALPAFDFPVKKLPVTSSRLGSIFDFHCSLTKPPGMLLFKHAAPSPQTTAAAKREKFPGQLYRFSVTSPQFLISHSGRRQMHLTDTENLPGIHLAHACKAYLIVSFKDSTLFVVFCSVNSNRKAYRLSVGIHKKSPPCLLTISLSF